MGVWLKEEDGRRLAPGWDARLRERRRGAVIRLLDEHAEDIDAVQDAAGVARCGGPAIRGRRATCRSSRALHRTTRWR